MSNEIVTTAMTTCVAFSILLTDAKADEREEFNICRYYPEYCMPDPDIKIGEGQREFNICRWWPELCDVAPELQANPTHMIDLCSISPDLCVVRDKDSIIETLKYQQRMLEK